MIRYLTVAELLALYHQVIQQSGGYAALQNPAALESAAAQPRQTFDGNDLYPTVIEKAA